MKEAFYTLLHGAGRKGVPESGGFYLRRTWLRMRDCERSGCRYAGATYSEVKIRRGVK